jgi:acetyl-CoA carboxylase carboxyl transferase beta subunit
MADSRIDVSIEHKHALPEPGGGKKHPNTCPKCSSHYREDELAANLRVCAQCGYHFPVGALERIQQLLDPDSFVEEATELRSADPLNFFDLRAYKDRIAEAELKTGLGDAMLIGQGKIEGGDCQLTVMDFSFMAGSMGSVVGEKFARACERAIDRRVPLISVNASGGARMQEGILSLMQVPKTVCAVENMRDARVPFISVLTHPTTAGLLASFATLGDVTIAEPGTLMCFTGPRVVQQTVREDLPEDFGHAESNYRFGHLDAIVQRRELRSLLAKLLRLFANVG